MTTSTVSYSSSLLLNITMVKGKLFKVLAETVRACIKNQHGYKATLGLTDTCLGKCPVFIRFTDRESRDNFEKVLLQVLHPNLSRKITLKHMKVGYATSPVRMVF